jgi:hypothetical protein
MLPQKGCIDGAILGPSRDRLEQGEGSGLLGVDRKTLYRNIEKYNISVIMPAL